MRPNLINRLKEEWNNLDPVDPLRRLIADAIDALAEQPAQQQEPVVRWVCKGCRHEYMEAPSSCDCMESREYERVEYFTSPPASKPWVGLTDEEAAETAYKGYDEYWTEDCKGSETEAWAAAGLAIEAKLREKNAQPSKPLTDEKIEEIAARTLFPVSFARAIEAAHGIKGDA